jgi:hypothetical protein
MKLPEIFWLAISHSWPMTRPLTQHNSMASQFVAKGLGSQSKNFNYNAENAASFTPVNPFRVTPML